MRQINANPPTAIEMLRFHAYLELMTVCGILTDLNEKPYGTFMLEGIATNSERFCSYGDYQDECVLTDNLNVFVATISNF